MPILGLISAALATLWCSFSSFPALLKTPRMCGVQSNFITVADATAQMSADSPYLPDFVTITAQNFRIRDVSADMAYSSRRNLHAIDDVGGTPYIPFKTGSVAKPNQGYKADSLWTQMYHHFTLRQQEFNRQK